MTEPAETPAPADQPRVRSEYQPGQQPELVRRWEAWANSAPSDTAALVQLAYAQALQVRAVKLILIWTLIILPIVIGVGLAILLQASEPVPRPLF